MRTIVLQLIMCSADTNKAAAAGLQAFGTCFMLDPCGLRDHAGHTCALGTHRYWHAQQVVGGSATSAVPFMITSAPATWDVHIERMVALPPLVH